MRTALPALKAVAALTAVALMAATVCDSGGAVQG